MTETLLGTLGVTSLTYVLLAVFAGAFVKGYSGFGASMMWVASLSLVMPPDRVVPMVLLWEVASSFQLLPGVWRKIEWRSLGWLSLGAGIATPVGVLLLASFSADTIRILIGIVVLLGSFLIWRGISWAGQPSLLSTVATGLTFGILNGSTALGGPPVVLFYLATPVGAAVGRASIIAFFLATDALAAGSQAIAGVLSLDVLVAASLFLPVVLVGAWAGARHFIQTDPEDFKRFSLFLLMGLGIVLLLRSTL